MLISTNQKSEHYLIGNPLSKKKKKPATATTTDTTFQSTRTKNIRKKEKKHLPRVCCHFFLWFSFYFFLHLRTFIFLSSTFRNLRARVLQVITKLFLVLSASSSIFTKPRVSALEKKNNSKAKGSGRRPENRFEYNHFFC